MPHWTAKPTASNDISDYERHSTRQIADRICGLGAIARRAADRLLARNDNIVLAGTATRRAPASDRELASTARRLPAAAALTDLAPDMVVESAGRVAVEPWDIESLRCTGAFAVCSTSAFTDVQVLRLAD